MNSKLDFASSIENKSLCSVHCNILCPTHRKCLINICWMDDMWWLFMPIFLWWITQILYLLPQILLVKATQVVAYQSTLSWSFSLPMSNSTVKVKGKDYPPIFICVPFIMGFDLSPWLLWYDSYICCSYRW